MNRGLAYIDIRKFELAASDIDTALKLKSCNLSEAYYGKALILINAGEEQQALKGTPKHPLLKNSNFLNRIRKIDRNRSYLYTGSFLSGISFIINEKI